jgi:Putative phage serine protease XkdF
VMSELQREVKIIKAGSDEQRYTLGIVYEPDVPDDQGDWASADSIREAAWRFAGKLVVAKASAGLQHKEWGNHIAEVVETYIAPCDMQLGEHIVKSGSWLMGLRWSEQHWPLVKAGEITGLSMGGKVTKVGT